jgi:hypothetical protein
MKIRMCFTNRNATDRQFLCYVPPFSSLFTFYFLLLLQFPRNPLILQPMATLTRLYPLLKQLGLDDQRSQEFIETLETGLLDQIATKTDIEKIRAELKTDIEKVRGELLVKIEGTKSELIRWLFGAWVTLFLAILALFLKLPG